MTRLLTERLLEAADRVPPLAAHDLRALLEVAADTINRLEEELVEVQDAYEELAAECERLRNLLVEIERGCSRRDMPSEQTISSWADVIDAAMQEGK